MTNPERYINRESDGTTYWYTDDGWMAAPTQTDGTPDLHCASYVVDFEEYSSREDYAELAAWLRTQYLSKCKERGVLPAYDCMSPLMPPRQEKP